MIAEKESWYEAAILPDSDSGMIELRSGHTTPPPCLAVAPASLSPPRPVAGRAVRRLELAIENTTQALLSMQPIGEAGAASPSWSCPESPDSCGSQRRLQEYEDLIRFSRYPTPPDAPRKDQYIPESESEAESPRPPPSKVFRDGKLMYHKTFTGQAPITFVDTRLYEGGHNDYFEAYNKSDIRWLRRIHYLLEAHNIPRLDDT